MSLTLHLGVVDVPYKEPTLKVERYGVTSVASITTGDVASILEAEYHPMEIYFNLHERDVALALEDGLAGVLESLLTGAPLTLDLFGSATAKIEEGFKAFLSNGEMEALGYPGVPTAASGKTDKRKGGVNHRLKHPYASDNPSRPSFIDTGEYQASFKVWVD